MAEYKSPRIEGLPSFTGGLVGYFSFDYLGYSEPAVRCHAEDSEDFKDVDVMLFDQVIAFDNLRQKIVLSNRLSAPFEGSLLNTYRVLRTINPSPYMFYFSGTDVEVAGASPETLVKLEDGVLHTFPLAGTRPRGKTEEEDRARMSCTSAPRCAAKSRREKMRWMPLRRSFPQARFPVHRRSAPAS